LFHYLRLNQDEAWNNGRGILDMDPAPMICCHSMINDDSIQQLSSLSLADVLLVFSLSYNYVPPFPLWSHDIGCSWIHTIWQGGVIAAECVW